jgi:hypothetical protein
MVTIKGYQNYRTVLGARMEKQKEILGWFLTKHKSHIYVFVVSPVVKILK